MRWLASLGLATLMGGSLAQPLPPVPKKVPHKTELHGRTLTDSYFWMRNRQDPDVLAHLKAENAYGEAVMAPQRKFRELLFQEKLARIQQEDSEPPVFDRGYWYYSRTLAGKEYPILCRKKGSLSAPEEVMLDVNQLAKGKKYMEVGFSEVSPDGRLLAYSTDETGYRVYRVRFKDLKTGKDLPDSPGAANAFVWAKDGQTYYLVTEDASKRWDKVWRHRLGSTEKDLVFEDKDPLYYVYAEESSDRSRLVITSTSKDDGMVAALSLASPYSSVKTIRHKGMGRVLSADFRKGHYYLLTDDMGPNGRLLRTEDLRLDEGKWEEVIPVNDRVVLSGVSLFEDFIVLSTRRGGFQALEVMKDDGTRTRVPTPDLAGSISLDSNPDRSLQTFRYNYQSLSRPRTVYERSVETGKASVLKVQKVKGEFRPDDYVQKVVWATAKDGVKIPISIVHHKNVKPSPSSPFLLEGYGSYGSTMDPWFSSSRLSLLNRGVVYGIPFIRGGGEFGFAWYEAAKMSRKMTTFTDFIACADFLVKEGMTSHQRLAISGASAGGLLMGAVVNLRPDLASMVVAGVPFVDVINTMLDESLPLTTGEFVEWGNPKIKEQYEWMAAYSPYDNVEPRSYPNMLITVGWNDSQVPYWEGAKWAAKLRENNRAKTNILLFANLDAGHGGSSGRFSALREVSREHAWLLAGWGITK